MQSLGKELEVKAVEKEEEEEEEVRSCGFMFFYFVSSTTSGRTLDEAEDRKITSDQIKARGDPRITTELRPRG